MVLVHARVVSLLALCLHGPFDQQNEVCHSLAIDDHVQIGVQSDGSQLEWSHPLACDCCASPRHRRSRVCCLFGICQCHRKATVGVVQVM